MTLERTHDVRLIREVLTHKSVYGHITDDGSPKPEDFEVLEHPSVSYVVARDGGDVLGLFMLVQDGAVCFSVHTCLLPHAWGGRASEAARELLAYVWRETPAARLTTTVPSYNRLALRFAERAGLTQYGLNPKSCLKRGVLWDQILLGVSKPNDYRIEG